MLKALVQRIVLALSLLLASATVIGKPTTICELDLTFEHLWQREYKVAITTVTQAYSRIQLEGNSPTDWREKEAALFKKQVQGLKLAKTLSRRFGESAMCCSNTSPELRLRKLAVQAALNLDFLTADARYQKALQQYPENSDLMMDYALFLLDINRPEAALKILNQLINFTTPDSKAHGDVLHYRANAVSDMNHLAAGRRDYQAALMIRSRLPHCSYAGQNIDLSTTLNNLAANETDEAQHEDADSHGVKALELRKKLAKNAPFLYQANLALTHFMLAENSLQMQNNEEAFVRYRSAAHAYEAIPKAEISAHLENYAYVLQRLSKGLLDNEDYPAAINVATKAVQTYRKLSNRNTIFRTNLAEVLQILGMGLEGVQSVSLAEVAYNDALTTQRAIQQEDLAPEINSLLLLHGLYENAGRMIEAEQVKAEAIALTRRQLKLPATQRK